MAEDWGDTAIKTGPEDWGDPAAPTRPTGAVPPSGFEQYAAQQLERAKHPGPGFMAGFLPGLGFLGGAVIAAPEVAINGIADLFSKGRKAWSEGLTPNEEVEFATNAALATIGGGEEFKLPRMKKPTAFEDFHEQVTKPAAEAMVGVPNSIEPPRQITIPLDPRNVAAQFPPPGVPRSQLALTGDPTVDTVVNSVKGAIDGATRPEGLPRALEVDGKVFDPADPSVVREKVTQQTAKILRDGGMSEDAANRVAAKSGEKAETAWYAAHGIDKANADAALAPYREAEVVKEPTDRETARANNIVADMEPKPEPATPPQANPLQEAHELGVIGGPERPEMTPPPPVESPAVAAQRAIPANARQGDKITMTPAGEPISDWEERFNDWVDRLQSPEDVKPFISDAAARNNNFADARAGEVNPMHVEVLADAAGLDPAKVDRGQFRQVFDTADKVRMAKEAMDQSLNKFKEAALEVEKEPTAENIAKMLEAEIRRDYIIEQLLGLRAEWGRTGRALKDLLAAREGPKTGMLSEEAREALKEKPETPKNVEEVIDAAREFTKNAATKETGLGLDKLIAAAEKLVDETKPKEAKPGEPKTKAPELDPDVKELVKTAQAVVNLMRPKEAVEPPTATVRPLRKIEGLGEPGAKPSPIADMNKLISEAERNVTTGVKEGKPVRQAMSKELADMIDAAENVTSHFGGAGLKRAIEDLLTRKGRTPEDMQKVARSMRGLTNEQAARVLTDMRGKQQHWFYWMWQQGLISGEVTHTKYVLTNLGFSTFDRVISPAVASVISHLRGGEKTYFGEPMAGLFGLIRGVPDAWRGAMAAFRSGLRMPLAEEMQLADRAMARGERLPRDLLHTQAIPYGQPGAPNWGIWQRVLNDAATEKMTRTIGISGRMASAIHTFFKLQNTRASMSARAYHEAAKEGLNPLSKEFEDRYNYHYSNPTDEALRGSVQDGYSGTFMDKIGPGEQWLAGKVQNSPAKWLFPFMHIPINIVRQSIRYSPMGWVTKAMRDDLTGRNGETAQNLAIAKMVVGTSILGYFVHKGMTGEATGDYPHDPNERREWQINGKIPNAVQFHGQWIQLQRFGPQGMQAALGADIGNIIRRYGKTDNSFDEKMLNIVGYSTLSWLHSIANEAGFMTLQSLFDLYEGRQSMAQWLGYQASTLVPFSSFIRQTASVMDPYARQAKTLLDGLKMLVPGERQTLLPRRDPLYGEPIHNPGYHTFAPMVPVQPADPVKQELNRIGYFPTAPSNKIGGVKLTPEQYDRYEATAGPFVKKALAEYMSSPQWKMHDGQPDWQKEVAKALVSEARRKAAGAMQADSLLRDGPNNLAELGRQRRRSQILGGKQ